MALEDAIIYMKNRIHLVRLWRQIYEERINYDPKRLSLEQRLKNLEMGKNKEQ